MSYLYSATTNGFYDNNFEDEDSNPYKGKLPSDCVEITDDTYKQLIEAQSNGQMIEPDENGYPVAVDQPEKTDQEIEAEAEAEAEMFMQDIAYSSLIEVLEDTTGDNQIAKKVKDKNKEKIKKEKEKDKNKDDTTTTL